MKGLGRENERILKAYQDFSGGWNADVAPDSLDDRELELADNITLDERGAFSKRAGTLPLNSAAYEDPVEKIIEWPRDDGTMVLLAVIGYCLVVIDENDEGKATLLKEFDDEKHEKMGYYWFQDKFYFTGFGDTEEEPGYWVYDGDEVDEVEPNGAVENGLDPIKKCTIFTWSPKSMRIFATGNPDDPTALYFSEPIDPTYFKVTSVLHPTTADGPTTGLSTFGDALVVTYRFSVWVWKGTDPAKDAVWTPLPVTHGTFSNETISWTPNSLTFLSSGNLVSLHLGVLDYTVVMMAGEELVGTHSKNKVSSILRSITNPGKTVAIFDRRSEKYYLAYSDEIGEERNNKILVMDWGSKSFVRYTGIQVNDFCYRSSGELLIASDKYILIAETGLNDWDTEEGEDKPIEMEVHTKQYDLGEPFARKKFHRIFLATRQWEGTKEEEVDQETIEVPIESSVEAEIIVDYARQERLIPIQESLWANPWGGTWGWRDLVTKELRFGGQKLKGLRGQLIFQNSKMGEKVTIYGMAFEYKSLRPRGVKIQDG